MYYLERNYDYLYLKIQKNFPYIKHVIVNYFIKWIFISTSVRFALIWLETSAYITSTASQVDVIVVKHSWFRIGFWVQGSTRPVTPLPSQEVFGFHCVTVICFRYTGCWISDFTFKSIKDSLGLLNPSWLFSQLGKLSLKSMGLFINLSS